ncbi:hypothetical protein [Streptomyces sp. NRRL WC-3742]|uniref:hypothetical protein n=1 Tax=Streptomyces sp. NRRL WC-3742 TaxID=1463934 RepID=UPI0004C63287|nr:hypothetical protein [Streptomyces sp. NRRL WC-3742]
MTDLPSAAEPLKCLCNTEIEPEEPNADGLAGWWCGKCREFGFIVSNADADTLSVQYCGRSPYGRRKVDTAQK